MRWVVAMKAPKLPATLPVVGTQLRALTSTLTKAFTNSWAASFSSLTPAAGGY